MGPAVGPAAEDRLHKIGGVLCTRRRDSGQSGVEKASTKPVCSCALSVKAPPPLAFDSIVF